MNPHARLQPLIRFYHQHHRMPSLRALAPLWGFHSETVADKLCQHLRQDWRITAHESHYRCSPLRRGRGQFPVATR